MYLTDFFSEVFCFIQGFGARNFENIAIFCTFAQKAELTLSYASLLTKISLLFICLINQKSFIKR